MSTFAIIIIIAIVALFGAGRANAWAPGYSYGLPGLLVIVLILLLVFRVI